MLVGGLVGLTALCGLGGCQRPLGKGPSGTPTAGADMDARKAPVAAGSDELPQDGALNVSLRALLKNGKSERPILENEILHSGDHIYFILRTSQAAYLYVVLFAPDGSASVLFPQGDEKMARVPPRCPIRIPAADTFYLQSPAGLQDLRIIASAEPLARADRKLCDQLRLPCQLTEPVPVGPCKEEGLRALLPSVKVAAASARGVASIRMTIRHEE